MQSTTNFRPVSLKKEVGHFSRNLWPRISKKSQKISNFWKNFFSLETSQNALWFVRNTICAVHEKFQAGISQKRSWSFFKKSVTPDKQKKSKNFKFLKKFFFALWNEQKSQNVTLWFALKFVRNTICAVHDKFQAGISQKRSWSFFKKSVTPDMQKKSKNWLIFRKNFFSLETTLKRLKIRSQHHLCSPRQISGRYLSKKKLVIFQEICDPGYAKKVKKFKFLEKIFFARNNLKCLKICSQHHLWNLFDKFHGISQKKVGHFSLKKDVGHFSRNLWPRICKKSSKMQIFQKKIFFPSKQPKAP